MHLKGHRKLAGRLHTRASHNNDSKCSIDIIYRVIWTQVSWAGQTRAQYLGRRNQQMPAACNWDRQLQCTYKSSRLKRLNSLRSLGSTRDVDVYSCYTANVCHAHALLIYTSRAMREQQGQLASRSHSITNHLSALHHLYGSRAMRVAH